MQTEFVQLLISLALKIARQGKGCLLVLGSPEYDLLVEQRYERLPLADNLGLVEELAGLDGAAVFDSEGFLVAYGALIKNAKPFMSGFGTRHAAAFTASLSGVAVLASEGERKVRVFQGGELVKQLDCSEECFLKKRVAYVA